MGAYRCSFCGINYSSPAACENCGGSVWWGVDMTPSDDFEKDEAVRDKIKKHADEWADPVDKVVNWRFEQLYLAGYDLSACEHLAQDKRIDLHQAVELAQFHGAEAAYLRFF